MAQGLRIWSPSSILVFWCARTRYGSVQLWDQIHSTFLHQRFSIQIFSGTAEGFVNPHEIYPHHSLPQVPDFDHLNQLKNPLYHMLLTSDIRNALQYLPVRPAYANYAYDYLCNTREIQRYCLETTQQLKALFLLLRQINGTRTGISQEAAGSRGYSQTQQ